jgi:hypothetical protein
MAIEFTKIKHDGNGNPRYVCHFFELIPDVTYESGLSITDRYAIACKRANRIGGRKFHNKQYGGGIVFSSYSLPELEQNIARVVENSK